MKILLLIIQLLLKGLTIDWKIDSFRNRSIKKESLANQIILKTGTKVIELRSYEKLPIFVADLSGILDDLLKFILLTVNVVERIVIDRKLYLKC